jgi:[ribosomal protein S5]-alanine N-acetyltransferase
MNNPPILETPRLILRALRMEDAADMYEYAVDHEIAVNGLWEPFHTFQDSIDDLRETLERYAEGPCYDWAVEHKADAKMIGRIGLHGYHQKDERADLGYAYNRRYWGQGYGTEAAMRVLEFGFCELNLHRVSASVLPDNVGSVRLLQKIGMRYEGTKREITMIRGKRDDLHSYSILKPEWLELHEAKVSL